MLNGDLMTRHSVNVTPFPERPKVGMISDSVLDLFVFTRWAFVEIGNAVLMWYRQSKYQYYTVPKSFNRYASLLTHA